MYGRFVLPVCETLLNFDVLLLRQSQPAVREGVVC